MSMTEGYRSTVVDVDPAEAGAREIEFYLGAHLTITTDETGKVTHLAIMPYQEDPSCEDLPDWLDGDDGWARAEEIGQLAKDLDWDLPALRTLPATISWEI